MTVSCCARIPNSTAVQSIQSPTYILYTLLWATFGLCWWVHEELPWRPALCTRGRPLPLSWTEPVSAVLSCSHSSPEDWPRSVSAEWPLPLPTPCRLNPPPSRRGRSSQDLSLSHSEVRGACREKKSSNLRKGFYPSVRVQL